MSIVDSFDTSKALIGPENLYQKGNIAEKCIVTFSCEVLEDVLQKYELREEVYSATANGKIPIYSLMWQGEKILFYMSPTGSAAAGCIIDEVRYMAGVGKFIVFGSCGLLDSGLTDGKFIVPTESYRDEGMSYHFEKAGDYIEIRNYKKLADIFDRLTVPYVTGKSWTTDAIYRETVNHAAKRKADGCICVEMESAGLQAVCNYRGIELYTFFFGSDLVEGEVWKNVNLGTKEEKKHQINCFETALRVAELI